MFAIDTISDTVVDVSSSETVKEDIRRDETESTSMLTDDETLHDLTAQSSSTITAEDDSKIYIGIYSKAAGLSEQDMLERSISVVNDDSLLKMGVLFEIYSYCQKHQLTMAVCSETFRALLPDKFAKDHSLRTKAKKLYEDVVKIRRNYKGTKKSEQLEKLLDKPYEQRQSSTLTPVKKRLKRKIEDQKQTVTSLTRKLDKERQLNGMVEPDVYLEALLKMENLSTDVQNLTASMETNEQTSEVQKCEWQCERQKQIDELNTQLADKTIQLDDMLKRKRESIRNETKKVKRRDKAIGNQKEELCAHKNDIGQLNDQLELSSEKCNSLEQELAQALQSKRKCQRRLSYFKCKQAGDVLGEMGRIEEQLDECYRRIKQLTSENRELQEMVLFLEENDEIVTFQEGKYTDNVREVYMKLLNLGVGRRNIQDAIRVVLRKLAGLEVERLPSESLTSRMFVEAKILSEIQTAREIVKNKHNTLHYDETSKEGFKYGSIQVTTEQDQSYVLGLFDMDGGAAERYASFIKDVFGDLAVALQNGSETEKSLGQLVFSFINTMTDRCGTNACVDELLVKWREEMAPHFFDNFDNLSTEARRKLTHLNSFKCHLHFLVGMADEANLALKEFEGLASSVTQDERKRSSRIVKESESGTVRTVRTVCKGFQKQGSEEAGVMSQFAVFLDEKCNRARH